MIEISSEKIKVLMITFLIILVIFILVLISSIPYSVNNDKEEVKINTRSIGSNKPYDMISMRLEIKHNCNILNINSMNKNIGYSIVGNFNDSCISIYKNGERVHSIIANGYKNIIIGSNHNILTPLIKLSKYKNILISLENENDYVIVFDKAEEISVKNYIVNQEILFTQIPINYNIKHGFNEYDIQYLTNKYIGIKNIENEVEKVHLSHYKKFDEWEFKGEGQYIMSIVENSYNLDIIDKSTNEITKIRKNNQSPEIFFKTLINPNILIKNLDFILDKKDINTEYIELINGPANLVERFMKGKKSKKINYTMMINNKICIYKV